MKTLRTPVTILILLALQACSSFSPTQTQSANTPALADLSKPNSSKAQTFVMRGQIVLGHEVRSLSPCNSSKQYWLDIPADRFQQALQLVRSPYEPLYGEVVGHLETGIQDGFVSDYAARFVVDHINILSAENPNRCKQPVKPTQAFGTEPFWNIQFGQGHLTFQQMGQEKRQLTITSHQIEPQRRRYQFENGRLELNQRSCVDGMSDSLYGWSSTLTIEDKQYSGCATLSNQDATVNWTGTYQASSTKTNDFSVILQLNPDHSATTTYRYQSGADSVERGVWQQLSEQQIQVIMTHHQQQPLLSERLFQRQDDSLSATKEKVGNVVYPIADGGITLFKVKAGE